MQLCRLKHRAARAAQLYQAVNRERLLSRRMGLRTAARVAVLLHTMAAPTAVLAASSCPGSTSPIDSFEIDGTAWRACEDLQVPDGALVLVSADGEEEWFPKTYSMYGSSNDKVIIRWPSRCFATSDCRCRLERTILSPHGNPPRCHSQCETVTTIIPRVTDDGDQGGTAHH